MQRELAELIQFEVKDPRVGMVTVSAVEMSRDLAHATVYITMLDPDKALEPAIVGLRRAAGFLRRELGRRMRLRAVPELHFSYDRSFEEGARLSALIDQAVHQHPDPDPDHSED